MVKFRKSFIKFLKSCGLLVLSILVFTFFHTMFLSKHGYINIVNESLRIPAAHSCTKTSLLPSFVAHLPQQTYTLCSSKAQNNNYEVKNHHKLMLSVLRKQKGAVLLDFGAGSGELSLAAASHNHQVIAVESNYLSVALLRKGAELSGLTGLVKILFNRISDEPGRQGIKEEETTSHNTDDEVAVSSVTLENVLGLLNVDETAIISIDTPGYDCKAITGFLWRRPASHVVPYIWMRWSNVYTPKDGMSSDCDEFPQMLEGFRVAEYTPYTDRQISVQDLMSGQHESVLWIHRQANQI